MRAGYGREFQGVIFVSFFLSIFGTGMDGEIFLRNKINVRRLCLLVSYAHLVTCRGRFAIVVHWFDIYSLGTTISMVMRVKGWFLVTNEIVTLIRMTVIVDVLR